MRKRSLLITVGLFLLLIFTLSTILNTRAINSSYSALQMEKMQTQAKEMTDYIRSELLEYEALSWLIGYWEAHYAELDIPVGGLQDQRWLDRHEAFRNADVKNITSSEAESLSKAEQKAFAEVCYMRNAALFDKVKQDFHLLGLNCSMYRGNEEAFGFFNGLDEDSPDKAYALGKIWPFHAALHPVAGKIYDTGRDINETEQATSTTDGREYLFVYSPVVIDGQLRCLICETLLWSNVKAEIEAGARSVARINALQLFAAFAALLGILYILVIRPLSNMQKSVRRYQKDKDSAAVRPNLERIAKASDEIGFLASDVSEMMGAIDRYVEEVRTQTAEKERVSTELSMATKIQEAMLPDSYPAFPERSEFDIYATMTPAREVGGDFYDFFLVDDDRLCMVMADVSGKGVPAALFMMASRIILQNNAMMGKSPAQILSDTNAAICANNRMEMFVTVWLGILEISTGRLTAANAGHEYPAIRHADSGFELLKDKHGLVIGGMKGMKYKEYELVLKPGEKLFVYTDGVPEATDASDNMFGIERMLEALNGDPDADTVQVLENVRASVDEFVKDARQFDDMTMLCMEYKGKRLR